MGIVSFVYVLFSTTPAGLIRPASCSAPLFSEQA